MVRQGVRVVTTWAGVEELRDAWNAAVSDEYDVDIDHFRVVVETTEETVSPYVLVVDRPSDSPLLVVARLVRERFPLRVGFRDAGAVTATAIVSGFEGVLGLRTDEDARLAVEALEAELAAGAADLLMMHKIEVGSSLDRASRGRPGSRWHGDPPMRRWLIDLPESWDALLAARSGSSRGKLRADDRRFERAFPDAQMRRLDLPEHRDRLWSDMDAVGRKTYQRALGVSISGTPMEQRLMREALERGDLRVWMLYLHDQPAAYWAGVLHHGIANMLTTGYDPAYTQARAGYYALRRTIAGLCEEPGVDIADFGHGDQDYKERFGTRFTEHVDVTLYSRRPRAVVLRWSLAITQGLNRTVKSVLARTENADRVRRWLRERAVAARTGKTSD